MGRGMLPHRPPADQDTSSAQGIILPYPLGMVSKLWQNTLILTKD